MFAIVVENLPLFVILKAKPEGSLKFFGRKLPVCPRAKRLANKQQSSEAFAETWLPQNDRNGHMYYTLNFLRSSDSNN